jgi:hypothetical protein
MGARDTRLGRRAAAAAVAVAALAWAAPAGAGGDDGGGGGDGPLAHLWDPGRYVPPGPNVWNIFYVRELTPEELRRRAEEWARDSPVDVLTIEQRMQWIAEHGGWYPRANPIDGFIALFLP